jgi:hypothetical protein
MLLVTHDYGARSSVGRGDCAMTRCCQISGCSLHAHGGVARHGDRARAKRPSSADGNGLASGKRTRGLLQRRHIRIERLKYIGKESNHLEEVESGLVHAAASVYTEYPDPRHDEWQVVCQALRQVSLDDFERLSRKSRRMLIDARKGRRRPHPRNRRLLARVARQLGKLPS